MKIIREFNYIEYNNGMIQVIDRDLNTIETSIANHTGQKSIIKQNKDMIILSVNSK